jgi:hypothetical protein
MVFYISKPKLFVNQLLLVLLIALGVRTMPTADPTMRFVATLLVVVFGVFVAVTIPELFRSEPRVAIDNQGIRTRQRSGFDLITWDDIQEIRVITHRIIHRYLVIELKKPDTLTSQAAWAKGGFRAQLSVDRRYVDVSFFLLQPSLGDAIRFIESSHPEKLSTQVA